MPTNTTLFAPDLTVPSDTVRADKSCGGGLGCSPRLNSQVGAVHLPPTHIDFSSGTSQPLERVCTLHDLALAAVSVHNECLNLD